MSFEERVRILKDKERALVEESNNERMREKHLQEKMEEMFFSEADTVYSATTTLLLPMLNEIGFSAKLVKPKTIEEIRKQHASETTLRIKYKNTQKGVVRSEQPLDSSGIGQDKIFKHPYIKIEIPSFRYQRDVEIGYSNVKDSGRGPGPKEPHFLVRKVKDKLSVTCFFGRKELKTVPLKKNKRLEDAIIEVYQAERDDIKRFIEGTKTGG